MNCGQEFTLLLGSQRRFDREEQMIDSFYIKKHIFSIQQFIIKLLILKISNDLLSRYCNDLKIITESVFIKSTWDDVNTSSGMQNKLQLTCCLLTLGGFPDIFPHPPGWAWCASNVKSSIITLLYNGLNNFDWLVFHTILP